MHQVQPLFETTDLSQVTIKGSVGQLLRRFIENRITSEYARTVVYREAEDAFQNRADDETVVGYWQGEFWGKWIIGAARVCRYLGDAGLKEFIRRGVRQLISYQREDGYIGTYRDSLNVFACDRTEAAKVVGWECNWNWNIWCRKYSLWGLIESYLLLEDPKILEAARRHADQLIGELHAEGIRICDTGVFNGLPSSSIMKPMVLLWEITSDRKYLDFALEIAGYWELADGRCPNLIANARSGKPLHEWYPQSRTWAKAYEMMSCLDGLLALYRATGEEKYFETVERIYELLLSHEYNVLFSVGYNDMFAHALSRINAVSEPCDVIHWMRISYELYMLTGKSRYMDLFELAFYNAFLAGVYSDGKWGSRGVRSTGRHITALLQAGFTKNHCCVNNLPRGFMNMAQAMAVKGKDGIYLNLFSEAEAVLAADDGRPIRIRIEGEYLQRCAADIEIDSQSAGAATLHIRIPAWSRQTVIRMDDRTHHPAGGGYFPMVIRPGKTRIRIAFDSTPELREHPRGSRVCGPDEWHSRRWTLNPSEPQSYVPYEYMVKQPMGTVRVGPLLLARSKRIGNSAEEMFTAKSVCGGGYRCRVTPMPMEAVRCGFRVEFVSGEDRFETMMCDYASAGNDLLYDEAYFNIFV